jgi:beta-lactamase regulating signal transducer with metallopeptidase domain
MPSWLCDFSSVWSTWVTATSIQVVVLAAIVAFIDRLTSRWARPQFLSAIWMLVIAKLLLPPGLSSPMSIARFLPRAVEAANSVAAVPRASGALVAFAIWAAGVVLIGGIGIRRYLRIRRDLLSCPELPEPGWLAPLTQEVARQIGLVCVPRVTVRYGVAGPAVLGFIRPLIVLPAEWLLTAPRLQVEHVLLHELCHVKRGDPIANVVCLAVQLAYWFHPAAWLARVRLGTLRELCCDQTVAYHLRGRTAEYRDTLLEFARRLYGVPSWGELRFIHRHSQLMARLDWLERPQRRGLISHRAATGLVVGGLLATCVPLARPVAHPSSIALGPGEFDAAATELAMPAQMMPATAFSFQLPPIDDLPGCLQRRYVVLGMLAAQEAASTNP